MVTNCYADVATFIRGAMGIETASLLGGNSTLATAVAAGATSLTVADGTSFAAGACWILDGAASEMVMISTIAGATLTLSAGTPTVAAHGVGASIATSGTQGALAEVLVRASAWVEGYCGQGRPGNASDPGLFALSRTEHHRLPGTRAALGVGGELAVWPLHFPVQSVASLALDWGQGQTWTLDATKIIFTSSARSFDLPPPLPVLTTTGVLVAPGGLPRAWSDIALSRAGPVWVNLTYQGGLVAGAMPWDFTQAVCWVAAHLLGYRENPTGAAQRQLGKKTLVSRLRGDMGDESTLLADAKGVLEAYRNRHW
ncbi:MAG: hypothetical protein H0X24_02590 [Ktedonobacterales bacterium]|nr:hypothetical protein [Ktedonobacterales bacterium]